MGSTATYRSAGPLPADVEEVLKEKGEDVLPEELDTKKIGLQAAEGSLLRRWEQIQEQKKKLNKDIKKEEIDKVAQITQEALAKKQTKRGNEMTAEELEISGTSGTSTPWSQVTGT